MTLILASVSMRRGAVLACDRLVNRDGEPFDRLAAKALIFRTYDGVAALGYTGLAYLKPGTPTDHFIAEILADRDIPLMDDGGPPSLMMGGTATPRSVGVALQRLRDEIQLLFTRPTLNSRFIGHPFALPFVGWQLVRKRRLRPMAGEIVKKAGSRFVELEWCNGRSSRQGVVIGAPEPATKLADVKRLMNESRAARTMAEDEEAFVNAIRRASAASPRYVGGDCTIIRIHPSMSPPAVVRFAPQQTLKIGLSSPNEPPSHVLDGSASTWVIGTNFVHAPSVLAGTVTLNLGGFEVKIEGPEPVGPGIRGAMGAIVRPSDPHSSSALEARATRLR